MKAIAMGLFLLVLAASAQAQTPIPLATGTPYSAASMGWLQPTPLPTPTAAPTPIALMLLAADCGASDSSCDTPDWRNRDGNTLAAVPRNDYVQLSVQWMCWNGGMQIPCAVPTGTTLPATITVNVNGQLYAIAPPGPLVVKADGASGTHGVAQVATPAGGGLPQITSNRLIIGVE